MMNDLMLCQFEFFLLIGVQQSTGTFQSEINSSVYKGECLQSKRKVPAVLQNTTEPFL